MQVRRSIGFLCQSLLLVIAIVLMLMGAAPPGQHLSPPPRPVPDTFFGMHFHHLGRGTVWPTILVGAWRLWDAGVAWPALEPRKDVWDFSLLDRYLDIAAQQHVDVIVPLALSPGWASARPQEHSGYRPGNAAEPVNLDDWRNYVATIVTHCRGRAAYYEVWNEPNLKDFFSGTTEQMLALAREAYAIVKDKDPQARVISPSAVNRDGFDWLDRYLALGGGKYADIIGYHFYVDTRPPEAMLEVAAQVRALMHKHGLAKKPLWDTEAGWSSHKVFSSPAEQASWLARAFILNWAAGVERFYWYSWDGNDWVGLHMTANDNNTPTPAAVAYTAVQQWLGGAVMKACAAQNTVWTCALERGGRKQWIVWNTAGTSTFKPPAEWRVRLAAQLDGATSAVAGAISISRSPVLLSAGSTH